MVNGVNGTVVRSRLDQLRVCTRLLGHVSKDRRVFVEFVLGIRLGRFQGAGLRNDEGVVAGPIMDAKVGRSKSDFLRMNARLFRQCFPTIPDLFNSALALGIRCAHSWDLGHLLKQIVVVENGDFGDLPQALCAEAHDPCIRSENNGSNSIKWSYLSNTLRPLIVQVIPLAIELDERDRQEPGQFLSDANGADRRPTTSVRRGKGLVQIKVTKVKASVPGPGYPQYSVGVCLVVGAKSACLVNDAHKLHNLRIKDPCVFRVCYQQPGSPFRNCRFQCL